MSQAALSFTVYMIHAMADAWGVAPSKAYELLNASGCIEDYLVAHYEVLHTLGTQHLVEDIGKYVAQRGYAA